MPPILLSACIAAGQLAAEEPPSAWFFNAHGTGSDYVYFSVGGTVRTPPQSSREVLLGWSWNDAGTSVERYPGSVPARYRPSRLSGKQPRQWHDDGHRLGVPAIGLGPGRELLLLGDDDPSTATAMRWAELLDSLEAAYRHSSPDLSGNQRHGELEVGRIGRCAIRSVPVEGEMQGWSSLLLAGHARPSRSGGFYYADRPDAGDSQGRARRRDRRTIEIQRFMRFLDGPEDCGGYGLDLSFIPSPREEAFSPPYFLVWTGLETRPLDSLDLEPSPRTPAVRTLARYPGTAREQINVATWPPATAQGIDLCRAPFMETLCLKDLRIRQQLATSAALDPAISGPLVAGCRDFFDRLPAVPSPHPCTDPGAWRRQVGAYRTDYAGELLLRDQPRLTSRVGDAGDVQWLWSSARVPDRATRFPLADGTEIELGMPRTAPPDRPGQLPQGQPPQDQTAQSRPPQDRPSQDRPSQDRPSQDRPSQDRPPQDRPSQDRPPRDQPPRDRPPRDQSTVLAQPGTATVPRVATTTDTVERRTDPTDPVSQPTPPPRDSATEPTPRPRDSATEPAPSPSEVNIEPAPSPDTTIAPSTPSPPPSRSPVLPDTGTAAPSAAMPRRLLWPIALAVLAMTAFVALMLRGQRASARARRQALASGLVAEDPAPEILLDEHADGQLLAEPTSSISDQLLLEPVSDTDLSEDTTLAEPEPETMPPAEPEPETTPPAEPEAETTPPAELEAETTPPAEPETMPAEPEPDTAPAESSLPAGVLPLEPPRLSAAPAAARSPWRRLAIERGALVIPERRGIDHSLSAITRLGEWIRCLLPVLDKIENTSGDLPGLDRLPPPAQREWRESCRALRKLADIDVVVFQRLRQELTGIDASSRQDVSSRQDGRGLEARYLSSAGLLDPEGGTLPERLRRHLLRPGSGRIQELVLALQYLIEAFPLEHLQKPERKAYLSAIRRRLQDKGLSTKFHQLVDELSTGLGLRYRQARYYKVRIEDSGYELLRDRHATIDLSQRLGYPATTDAGVVVRLSELFLSDSETGVRYSGKAWIDQVP